MGVPDAWQRHLGLLLDGFRAERAHPLPQPPLSPPKVYRAMLTLARHSTGTATAQRYVWHPSSGDGTV